MSRRTTRRAVLAAGAVALAGCLGETDSVYDPSDDGVTDADIDEFDATPDDDRVSETAIPLADEQLPVQYDLETLRDNVESGGVPQDGIPSIDSPEFESVDDVGTRLDDGDVVFGVVRNGEARAYPQSILVHHEIVNDVVGGDPICVTYCPLTGTAMGYDRADVEFGVSGNLLNSNLVMYDREGESYWPQMLSTAIEGPLTGASLREVSVVWARWGDWRERHPTSEVLTESTGYARDYGSDPYGAYNPVAGYYEPDSNTMFPPLTTDDRLETKRMVLGARPQSGPVAVDVDSLHEAGAIPIETDEASFLAVAVSNLETGSLYQADDPDEWTVDGDRVRDPDGDAHDPDDLPLERVYAFDAMWFAWVGYYPGTTLHE